MCHFQSTIAVVALLSIIFINDAGKCVIEYRFTALACAYIFNNNYINFNGIPLLGVDPVTFRKC